MNRPVRNRFYSDFGKSKLFPAVCQNTPMNKYFPESPRISNLVLDEPIEEFNLEEEQDGSIQEFLLNVPQRKGSIVSQFLNSKNNSNNLNETSPQQLEFSSGATKTRGARNNIFGNFVDEEIKENDNESIDSFEIEIETNKLKDQSKLTESSTNVNDTAHNILNYKFGNIRKDDFNYDNEFLDEFDNVSMECLNDNINERINQSGLIPHGRQPTPNSTLMKRDYQIFIEDEDKNKTIQMKFNLPSSQPINQHIEDNQYHHEQTNPFLAHPRDKIDCEKEINKEVDHFQGIVKHLLDVNKGISNNMFYMNGARKRESLMQGNSQELLMRNRSKSFNCSMLGSRPILEFMKNC